MSVHTLDIDSSERDPILYPDPSDYVIELRNPIYNVNKISIVSARIHASQLLINDRNNTFDFVHGTTVYTITLTNGNYSGKTLAAELQSKVAQARGSPPDQISFVYDSDKNEIAISSINASPPAEIGFNFYDGTNGYHQSAAVDGYTTPHDILGLPASNVYSGNPVSQLLVTGSLNLQGPDALVIKLSSGADEFNKTVFSDTPFYTGRILMCGDVINYSGLDDAVDHYFHSGPQKSITRLRVQFFYSSNNRLIPYDFRNANHIIKLAINCTTDKLLTTPKVKKDFSLPKPMRIPELEDPNRWTPTIYIAAIIFTGFVFMLFARPRPKMA